MDSRTPYQRIYRSENRERISKYQSNYRATHKETAFAYAREWYAKNKNRVIAKRKAHYLANKEAVLATGKSYRLANPEKIKARSQKYRAKNIDRIRAYDRARIKIRTPRKKQLAREQAMRRTATPQGRLSHRMASGVRSSLVGGKNGRPWEELVGYTSSQLKISIESQFTSGMSWEKFKLGEIHIDHRIPKSKFKYSGPEDIEFKRCWAIENLQPKWSVDNLKKNAKIEYPSQIPLGV